METLLSGSIGRRLINSCDLVIVPGDTYQITVGIVVYSRESDYFPFDWIRVLIHTGEILGYFSDDVTYLQGIDKNEIAKTSSTGSQER